MIIRFYANCAILLIEVFIMKQSFTEAALRIFGGRDAHRAEFPFAVRLELQVTKIINGTTNQIYFHVCTAAALTPVWTLSAAHCDDDNAVIYFTHKVPLTNERLVVRYNSHFPNQPGKVAVIHNKTIHPGYTITQDVKYDFVLFLTDRIDVMRYARVSGIDYTALIGHEATLLGFGVTVNATRGKNPLKVLTGIIIRCLVKDEDTVSMLCFVPPCGHEATICNGDSGGAVIHPSGIVGVNSMSVGNCFRYGRKLIPGASASIFSVISPVIDWISNTVATKIPN